MNLKTERLLLRNYKREDWERDHIYGSNPDFSKYELWGPNTLEDNHKFVAEMVQQTKTNPRYKFDFAVYLKENEQLIGGYGIRRETESSQVVSFYAKLFLVMVVCRAELIHTGLALRK